MKKIIWLLLLFAVHLVVTSSIKANGEFHSSFVVNYSFDELGNSTVDQQITLTNLLSHVYATSYTLRLRGVNPHNISGQDALGPLKISTKDLGNDTTEINITFNVVSAGRGESLKFNLHYDGKPGFKNGQIWEIALPKLTDPETIDNYTLNLTVPRSFGQPAYISPSSTSIQNSPDGKVHYSFTREQVISSGVVAAFGDFQTFDFHLTYHLQNTEKGTKTKSIALPPDTPYQRLFYDDLTPLPISVTTDPDGNWLATYSLKPKSTLQITTSGQVHLLGQPTVSSHQIPSMAQLESYLYSSKYWPADEKSFQDLAQKLVTPKKIYDYVVSTLSYDYSRLQSEPSRKGASQALLAPQSSLCQEFTDLFITLARASKIPARELNGFAFTNDPVLRPLSLVTDVLHAWPEYWDKSAKVWRSVDPTWGKTTGGVDYFNKLDLAHFVFAIHGTDPQNPKPAGLYKITPSSKDVEVKVGEYKDYLTRPIEITWKRPVQFLPLLKNSSVIEITNPNGIALYNLNLELQSQNLNLTVLSYPPIPVLPPFASLQIPITHNRRLYPSFKPKMLRFSVGSQSVTYNVADSYFLAWYASIAIVSTFTLLGVAFLAHASWHIYLQRRKK